MTDKDIQYKELQRRIKEIGRVEDLGVELVYKKDMFKIVLGSCLAGLGLITLPFPTGSIILISVGLSLVANGGLDVYKYKDNLIRKLRRAFL